VKRLVGRGILSCPTVDRQVARAAVTRFTEGIPAADDRTALVIKRRG